MEKEAKNIDFYTIRHLSQEYRVEDGCVYDCNDNRCWAYEVIHGIIDIYGFNLDEVSNVVRDWVESRGVNWDEWNTIRKLKATWSPEMAQDIAFYHNIDAEAELTALLAEEISKEIDDEILKTLTTFQGFEERMRHNGYVLGPLVYNPTDFTPRRHFIRA